MSISKWIRPLTFFHVIFAGFFLPVAVMFAVTGGLYTFEVKGEYDSQKMVVDLPLGSDPGLEVLTQAAQSLLADQKLAPTPSGSPGLRKVGTSWAFEWSGTKADMSIEPTETAGQYKVTYKRTSPHRFFVQLHKAKGGWPFKILAGGLAIGLLLLFASGVLMAFANSRLKSALYISLALGFLTFAICAGLS